MESKKEKLAVNNYIVFKHGSESLEGRIKSISHEGSSEVYQVLCFCTFNDIKVNHQDVLLNVSQEVKRKVKSTAYQEIPNSTYFPQILKNVLIVDKEWSQENRYEFPQKNTVSSILKQYREYLVNTASTCDFDEGNEAIKGFTLCFNTLFKKFLLYPNEIEQINLMKNEPSEYCGPVHLLRLIYYIQKNIKSLVFDEILRSVVLDHTIYLLDFMLFKYKEFF